MYASPKVKVNSCQLIFLATIFLWYCVLSGGGGERDVCFCQRIASACMYTLTLLTSLKFSPSHSLSLSLSLSHSHSLCLSLSISLSLPLSLSLPRVLVSMSTVELAYLVIFIQPVFLLVWDSLQITSSTMSSS